MRRTILLCVGLVVSCTRPSAPPSPYLALTPLLRDASGDDRAIIDANLDRMLIAALGAEPGRLSPREKALRLAWFTHSHLASLEPERPTIRRMIEQRQASCGGTALIYQLLARKAGLETRSGGFFGIPVQGGHVVVEVRWDGAWHFIDPTFGVFFTANGQPDGALLSMDEIVLRRASIASQAFYAQSTGRSGWGATTMPTGDITAGYGKTQTSLLSSGNYALFLRELLGAVVYEPDRELVFPVQITLSTEPAVFFGKRDGASTDVALHKSLSGRYDATGLAYLGAVNLALGQFGIQHRMRVGGLTANDEFEISYDFVHDRPHEIHAQTMSGAKNAGSLVKDRALAFQFVATAPEAEIVFSNSATTPNLVVDAISIRRL